jgi:tetratricopeptide (TPR) repeat protein
MKLRTIALIIAAFAGYAFSQSHPQHGQEPHEPQAVLLEGVGPTHHPVSTDNLEAQKFFDQGLALAYGFNHDEAARSFRKAAELDPHLAMAWWGYALVQGTNYNLPADADRNRIAYDALQKARELGRFASQAERDYIDALSKRYSADKATDQKTLDESYSQAMQALMKKYPDDLDAATLYAESLMNLRPWQLWNPDGTPAPRTPEILAVLEGVISGDPDHTGANHLYIHAIEASPHPARGLPSAYRLSAQNLTIGHLAHMPSHIYFRTGYYDRMVKENTEAAARDEAYLKRANVTKGMYPMMYYPHNIHFIVFGNQMRGNYAGAMEAAQRLRRATEPYINDVLLVQAFQSNEEEMLVRFRKWEEIEKLPSPSPQRAFEAANWHYAKGMAAAARGDTATAQSHLTAIREASGSFKKDDRLMINHPSAVLNVAAEVLEGHIMRAKKDFAASEQHLREAVRLQDQLIYMEPPEWYYPVRESLGAVLLQAGKPQEAEAVFREDLAKNPRNGRSLFGLQQALKAQKKDYDARSVEAQFKDAWKSADTELRVEDL